MAKVSIIVPVYNRKEFLNECVESLLKQTFSDFELWLVDDGSTDGSEVLCDSLEQTDSRIHVLHIKNGGAAHARAKGVEQASGEWILFVDSDDTLPADALHRLYLATSEETDIVIGFIRRKRLWGRKMLPVVRYRKLLIVGKHNISVACGRLFRRELFNTHTLQVPRGVVMGEDLLMNLRLSFATSKPVRLVGGESVYNYRQHGANITHVFKLTLDYAHLFHQERLNTIPETEHAFYMPVMIYRRLRMLRRLLRWARKEGTVRELKASPFVNDLLRDIQRIHYSPLHYPYLSLWKFLF